MVNQRQPRIQVHQQQSRIQVNHWNPGKHPRKPQTRNTNGSHPLCLLRPPELVQQG
jgi:hypothetical protein